MAFTPLHKLPNTLGSNVHWMVDELPGYVPVEQIGVAVDRIGRLARWSGIGHLDIGSHYDRSTVDEPGISGVFGNGTATASSAGVADKQRLFEAGAPGITNVNYPIGHAGVSLNMTEITDQVDSSEVPGSLRSAEVWSSALNTAIAGGIREVARDSLLRKQSVGGKSILPLLVGYSALWTAAGIQHAPEAVFVAGAAMQNLVNPAMIKMITRDKPIKAPPRLFSALPGTHYDRLAAVDIAARVQTFVRPL